MLKITRLIATYLCFVLSIQCPTQNKISVYLEPTKTNSTSSQKYQKFQILQKAQKLIFNLCQEYKNTKLNIPGQTFFTTNLNTPPQINIIQISQDLLFIALIIGAAILIFKVAKSANNYYLEKMLHGEKLKIIKKVKLRKKPFDHLQGFSRIITDDSFLYFAKLHQSPSIQKPNFTQNIDINYEADTESS